MKHRILLVGILCFIVIFTSASTLFQTPPKTNMQANKPATHVAQQGLKPKEIEIKYSHIITSRPNFIPLVLLDSVTLLHDGAVMNCDSAYADLKDNTFEAFSNVRINQGDSLFLYGNYLHYDGNTKLLKIRENVRLENRDMTLFTDSLDYDRAANIGYYFDGGMLVDSLNQLTSFWGQYEPNKRMSTFSDSVKLVNEKKGFTLYSDTLKYNTYTKVATILGPSRIETDTATIYTTRGWYDTQSGKSLLLDRSKVVNKEGNRILIGDSISYHRNEGFAEVYGNMFLQDTLKKIILKGDYGYYNQKTNYAMATKRAMCIEYSQGDSLYLHADTLKIITDSTFRTIKAYHNVRFYRKDAQGVCDSMQFNTKDSILYMYREPILWKSGQQLSGDTIKIMMNDSTIDRAHIINSCFAIEDVDSTSLHYNQVKGRSIKAFFKKGELHYVLVEGNAESIYFPKEKDKPIDKMSRTISSYLSMSFENKQLVHGKIWPQPKGELSPLNLLQPESMKLPDFQWFDYIRPLNKDDIFRTVKKKAGSEIPKHSSKFKQVFDE